MSYTFGLHSRGGETYLLVYHARMYPAGPKHAWSPPPSDQRLALEIVPSAAGGKLHVRVLWQGQPVDAAEVKADRPGNDSIEGTTNAAGEFSIPIGRPGLYALRRNTLRKWPALGKEKGMRASATMARSWLQSRTTIPARSKAMARSGRSD